MPTPVLKIDEESQTVTVAGSKGKYVQAAIEDTRHAYLPGNDFYSAVQEALNACERSMLQEMDEMGNEQYLAVSNYQLSRPVDAQFDGINDNAPLRGDTHEAEITNSS